MSSTGDQSALNFKERYISNYIVGSGASGALGANELCDRLVVTEVGMQIYSLTGTGFSMRRHGR